MTVSKKALSERGICTKPWISYLEQNAKLSEYKATLINSAVTGKFRGPGIYEQVIQTEVVI